MPTLLERTGDFSQSRNAFGQPVQVVDPRTGQPFPGNVIPADRITPQAAALLGYYPRPNAAGIGANYQTPIPVKTRQDSGQTRLTHQFRNGREQFQGAMQYQRTTIEAANLFSFVDTTQTTNLNVDVNHSHRLNQFMFLRSRYQLVRQTNDVTPFFANVTNVSGNAGIIGNNQSPPNWGPPALSFASGLAGLGTGQYAENTNHTNGASAELFWFRGRHSLTIGGGVRRQAFDVLSQQDARGRFGFTGCGHRRPISPTSSSACRRRARSRSATPTRCCGRTYRALRQRRLAGVAGVDAEPRRALGVRVADHRGPGTAGQSRRRHGFHRRGAGRGHRSERARDGHRVPVVAAPSRHARHPAAARPRVAAGSRLVAGGPRRLRHLPQPVGVPVDRHAARAAAAVLDHRQRPDVRGAAADAGDRAFRRCRRRPSTRLRWIRPSASAPRTTGRRRCSATCRRRSR